jgi:hypothetical protein
MADIKTPVLKERSAGLGWIAMPPKDSSLRFVVVGATRSEAEARYTEALALRRTLDRRREAIGQVESTR